MRFPYGCICRKNFFGKAETTDTTDTTICKPGLKKTSNDFSCDVVLQSEFKLFYKSKISKADLENES